MKHVKKALILTMVAAMLCGLLTVTASAATTYFESPLKTFAVTKVVNTTAGSRIPDDTTFTVTMKPASADEVKDVKIGSATAVNQGVSLTNDTVTFTFDSKTDTTTGTASDTESFDLSDIPFTATGVYRYYITETTGSESYITYDKTKYEVDLYVKLYTDSDTKTQSLGVGYYTIKKMTHLGNGTYQTEPTKPDTCTFTNTVNVANAKITKTVTGEAHTTNAQFDFYIRIPEGGDTLQLSVDDNSYIPAEIHRADGSVDSVKIYVKRNLTNAEEEANKLADPAFFQQEDISQKFELGDGDYLLITGAPQGMIYYVEEADYSSDAYTQTYTYAESGSVTSSQTKNVTEPAMAVDNGVSIPVKGTVNSEKSEMDFNNYRVVEVADTGIGTEMFPFALVMVIAGCGAVLYVAKKRQEI